MRYAILTVSDRCWANEREDKNKPIIEALLSTIGAELVASAVVPDEIPEIQREIKRFADELGAQLIVTNGGTGLSPRDVTPEATRPLCQKDVPGLAELMRWEGFRKTKKAALSRQYAGLRGNALVLNLPGSPRGTQESLEAVLELLDHIVEVQNFFPHPGEKP